MEDQIYMNLPEELNVFENVKENDESDCVINVSMGQFKKLDNGHRNLDTPYRSWILILV